MPRSAVALLPLLLAVVACSAPMRLRLQLTREDLQAELAPSFPISKDLVVAGVELTDPTVLLDEGSERIGVRFVAKVTVALIEIQGVVAVDGGLRFAPEAGTFYLRDPAIVEIALPGLSEEQTLSVRDALNGLLLPMLPEIPLHTLDDGATKMLLRSVVVRDGKLWVELGL